MSKRDWLPVRQIMRTDVTVVDGKMDVLDALRTMKRVQATCLMVEKRNERDEYGMVLFSDIAKQVLAKNRSPQRTNVYEIMSKPALAVGSQMDIRYCARFFERVGISVAPVIDGGEIKGLVDYDQLVLRGLVQEC